jgi:polyisoprenoid-binding protein YceI
MSTTTTANPGGRNATQTGETTTWTIDGAHTHVGFAIKHLMIATVRGRFTDVQGTVTLDERDPTSATADITINTATVNTGDEKRDAHLRSPDFFDVEHYPTMTFRSKRVEAKRNDALLVIGDLTIRGVTREVALDVQVLGRAKDPWGREHVAFDARGSIKRGDYGLTWNAALETGGVLVGDDVNISIEAQLLRQA